MKKILSFTAASGTGKTSAIKYLLDFHSVFRLLPSYTTREWREGDLDGEYVYLSIGEFSKMESNYDFHWTTEPHEDKDGNIIRYGTTHYSLKKALKLPNYSLMSAVHDVMGKLSRYAKDALLPFYIIPPEEQILRQRLKNRGDAEDSIEKRILDCKDWYDEAKSSGFPYTYITSNSTIKESAEQVIDKLLFFNPKPYKG